MNAKQQRFVAEYLKDLNATQAAIRAGYSKRSAAEQAYDLLRNPQIAAVVARKTQRHLDAIDITAERVKQEMAVVAFSDMAEFFDAAGNLKPIQELSPRQSRAIASLEVIIKNAQAGDGHTDTVHKIKVWDKTRSLEMLGKHFGLLTDKVEHSGGFDIRWKDSE